MIDSNALRFAPPFLLEFVLTQNPTAKSHLSSKANAYVSLFARTREDVNRTPFCFKRSPAFVAHRELTYPKFISQSSKRGDIYYFALTPRYRCIHQFHKSVAPLYITFSSPYRSFNTIGGPPPSSRLKVLRACLTC